ncbi:GNAT family N-acetyltransferase [Azospirillum sp. TSH100]|uniref:GNAT family N-acetyltransferase n=1 Tax=Azospirillum sp. TSH100 TaxID=652764 RepID=UPI000D68D965|nr:GNAT family N-acetyltransferase [Azospirillum sp. TSH100]QCG91162.1 GNAT family N-acetyltransferase [Azospirillum sp. TSH100]
MQDTQVTLAVADPRDLPAFKKELQDAFAVAVIEEFGSLPDGPIPSDSDLDESIAAPGAVVLHILCDGRKVGGAVVVIDDDTHRNSLSLFFISSREHGRGLGFRAWTAIERMYPQTRVWETHTPYFEKRNIHLYVNKCGFKIVEFFSDRHPDPQFPGPSGLPDDDAMFRFEKVM